MITQTHIPQFPLNKFVDYFFFYEGYTPAHSVERFLPDGNVELIIDLHDKPKFIYDNETLKEIQACHHVWASGVRTQPISIDSGLDAAMIVVFKKGLAYPFFPVPMNESVVFSPDGKRLATAYSGHSVRVWDIASGSELLRLRGKGRGITAIAFSADGKMLASCSWNLNSRREVTGIVEIWSADSGESLQQLNYGNKPLTAIAFSPDGLCLKSQDPGLDEVSTVTR